MSDRESCIHHFEQVKQTRPFTERGYMQCVKCGYQHPFGLFQHWDTERDGPVQDYFDAITIESSWTPTLGQYPPWYAVRGDRVRTCKVWKRKDYGLSERLTHIFVPPNPWYWQCRLCGYGNSQRTWKLAYAKATHHARNHHGR